MNKNNYWQSISIRLTHIITLITGVTAIVLSQLDLISSKTVLLTILGMLALHAITEIIEKNALSQSIRDKLEDFSNELSEASKEIKVTTFSNHKEYLQYLTKRINSATKCIEQASIDRSRRKNVDSERKVHEASRERVISSGKIIYRYIGVLYDERRLELAKKLLIDKKCDKFYAAYYPKPVNEIPLLNFEIIDRFEILVRYPFDNGKGINPQYISIKSSYIANLFVGYFDYLMNEAKPIHSEEDFIFFMTPFNK